MTENIKGFNYEKDEDGIVLVTMDMEGPVNTMNRDFREAIRQLAERLEVEANLKGVVLASAKKTFFAGADLKELVTAKKEDAAYWFDTMEAMKQQLRRIEKLPVPVVVAINGAALGGGFEICLACNARIAVDSPAIELGFPEVTLGLLPGAGGVVRSIHMLGLEKALPILTEGSRMTPTQASELGLVDELVDSTEALLPAARAWIAKNADKALKPWDKKGYRLPHGGIGEARNANTLAAAGALYQVKTRGLLPAPARILSVAHEVLVVDFDTALRIESRALVELLIGPVAKNLITANFFQMGQIRSGASRPRNIPPFQVNKVGILGAGMMGQGIAYSCALAGLAVVLKDVSLEAAEKGKAYSRTLLEKAVARGKITEEEKENTLALITPTTEVSDLGGCDFIVEAVFEDVPLKAKVTQEAEPLLAPDGVFSSNTSTLPIAMLAQASAHPEKFIGTHFFSPVDKMPLVEIIRGEKTSDETLAKAFDFARRIGKTPILVNDSLGFFTSRTFITYIDEGSRLLQEGYDAAFIDNMGKAVGMPVGPLTVFDEVSLELSRRIVAAQKAIGIYGKGSDRSAAFAVAEKMVTEFGRGGRHHGGGFYEYPPEGKKYLWPGLVDAFAKPGAEISQQDAKDRLLFRQVIEALKCLEEGVLRSVADGNIGSLLGIGTPQWTGGLLQFVNTYGLQNFIDRCNALAEAYGERFLPPRIVAEKLAGGELFV
ncbi:MAG: 3-hydroxyacyl-CoA dehydrogenase NAD-binding domain-containing protein [Porticoccaceae bacterium]